MKLGRALLISAVLGIGPAAASFSATAPDAGAVIPTGSMGMARAAHAAAPLPDGRVLIAGGLPGLSSTEFYDLGTGRFVAGPNMSIGRAGHTITLLPTGQVLIAGGYNGNYLDTAEVFDPKANRFLPTGKMVRARSGHTATLLQSGSVLLVGGVGTGWTFLDDAEVYDPKTGTFSSAGRMTTARESHTVTLLQDGRVLIAGGHQGRRSAIIIYDSAELYDPASGTLRSAGKMATRRHKHDAVLLADGRALITGGSDERDGRGAYRTSEVYDPATESFRAAGDMNLSRYKHQTTSVLLRDGRVFLGAGAGRPELYDPRSQKFELVENDLGLAIYFATATMLKSGDVLLVGGYDDSTTPTRKAWIYKYQP